MTPDQRYPSAGDLARAARARMPRFAWEYLDSGTGLDLAAARNVAALREIEMWPAILRGRVAPDLSVSLFGETHPLPFGIAPVGLGGLMWPGAERALARAAGAARIPFALSTFGTANMEALRRDLDGMGWFQLYPPRDPDIRDDLLARARANGYRVLVVTADVPVASVRERQRKAGVSVRMGRDWRMYAAALAAPFWLAALARHGAPRFWVLDPYLRDQRAATLAAFGEREIDHTPSWDYLKALRDLWKGPIVLKGVMRPEEAEAAIAIGIEGIGVSNHGGRQLDAAPAAIRVLPAIRAAVGGRAAVIFDSGLRGGLDILRALALGADFCLLGRVFYYGLGALGEAGPAHVVAMLANDLRVNMIQMGLARLADLPAALVRPPVAPPPAR